MFQFIHAADIHLDSPLRGLSLYESAPAESIRDACRKAFVRLVDFAIEEKVKFVLLAGDLYDGDWKDFSTGLFLSKQIGRLGKHDIDVYSVSGNHDAANRMTKSLKNPKNMTTFSTRKAETVRIDDLKVAIHGQSYPKQHVDENLANGYPMAERGFLNIGILHTSLNGYEGHADYAPCTTDELTSKGYHYWALGHVHTREIVSQDPWIVFPGCIQGRHIRETGTKGCMLVTVEDEEITEVKPIALDVFRFVQCAVDLTDFDELVKALEHTQKLMEEERSAAENLPIAMRIRFEGATRLAREIAASPGGFEQQIRALAAEIGGEGLWIERVENALEDKLDLSAALTDDGPLQDLLVGVMATSCRTDDIEGLLSVMTELRKKLPNAFNSESSLNLDAEKTVARLVEEAKQMLVGRLLTMGAAE